MLPIRFLPSKETLAVLNHRPWIATFSGGKDSTALVTWIEWLRRAGLVRCERPRLVQSDTEVEYPFLQVIAERLTERLTACGWECSLVRPEVKWKLYVSIFGRGVPPVRPSMRRMRWCTNGTKIRPMEQFARTTEGITMLSGVRWGESSMRDGKLAANGCTAGGECGLPLPGDGKYAPIITWKICQVIEWLKGEASSTVTEQIADLIKPMGDLLRVYDVRSVTTETFFGQNQIVNSLRFGCVGCPAVQRDKVVDTHVKQNPRWKALRRLYGIWDRLRDKRNRVSKERKGKLKWGPIKMAARQVEFANLLRIQEESGVTLVSTEDEAYIRQCWEDKIFPRGWSAADEVEGQPEK